MGDMAEVFSDLRKARKEEREVRATVNISKLQELRIPAFEQSKNVFRIDTEQGAVMYYPSSATWQHKGKIMRGNTRALKDWITRNGLL
jgi:hypothetical protein